MTYWIHSAPDDYTNDGQRECARGDRCTDPRIETVDGKPVRLPAFTPRAFCDPDRTVIEHSLTSLPVLWNAVHGEIGNKQQAAGPRVATSKSAPLPISLTVDALLREVVYVMSSWEERVAIVAGLTVLDTEQSRRRRHEVAVKDACRMLGLRVDSLLALQPEPMMRTKTLPEAAMLPQGTPGLVHDSAEYADAVVTLSGADAGLEVLDLHYRCRKLLTATRQPARHLPTPCGKCEHSQLYQVLDFDGQPAGAKCRRCGATYDQQGYDDLAKTTGETVKRSGVRPRSLLAAVDGDRGSGRA